MKTGVIDAMSPRNARRDIKMQHVQAMTSIPTGAPYGPPGSPMPAAAPGPEAPGAGEIKGADAAGRPVREFHVGGNPNAASAKVAAGALKRAAKILRDTGVETAVPSLVGGPLASLARGEAIILRWPNGIAVTAAL